MTNAHDFEAQSYVNAIVAALTVGAAIIWAAVDYATADRTHVSVTCPPAFSATSGSTAACSLRLPDAQSQAAGTAARELLVGVGRMEGTGGKSSG